MKWFRKFGPGLLVTAAFIGPGTVMTASRAGAEYGFALIWAIVFSVLATITLQWMAAKLGLVTRQGLTVNVQEALPFPAWKTISIFLMVSAIVVGNSAYQTGNVLGAALGLEILFGGNSRYWSLLIGLLAVILLQTSGQRYLQRLLIALVVVMSGLFVATAVWVQPNWNECVSNLIRPSIPTNSLMTIMALIGTTVVPYNLFLHATHVQAKWPNRNALQRSLREAAMDTSLAVTLGGVVTAAIVATAAAAFFETESASFTNASELAAVLQPIAGRWATSIFAAGLFAAGLTSSLTAPWAAAIVLCDAWGWRADDSDKRFKAAAVAIVILGTSVACLFRQSPQATILFAQATNGILLPLIAIFLLVTMNSKLLGEYRNGWFLNLLGGFVVVIAASLGALNVWKVIAALVSNA